MAITPCRTPVIAGKTKRVSQIDTCYNYWDVDPFINGISGSVMVLGYLANIWAKTCAPIQPPDSLVRYTVTGDGFLDASGLLSGDQCTYATIQITKVPQDTDMIFGRDPLVYVGVCGFGASTISEFSLETAAGTFSLGISGSQPIFGEMHYINRVDSIWFPDNPVENIFWWKLKDGVIATVTAYGTSLGNGFSGEFGNWCHWNPMAGGWVGWDEDSFLLKPLVDGCGNIVTPPPGAGLPGGTPAPSPVG